ncbi:hypothetical protein PC9H_001417 [Pleurotus ostreatus]|uniref:F-box domain-containing protein n=1 Tax=Pleurotus ostreatus TaxID=5322 RepID=A0A8H7DYP1_PLEOS|nr:uncharacterized protein PC9H_001417 [Pleurotus ostreatus]KAF7441068.1 hypothetical protein PC9H_001417 [Pleurotus ostreatus]
MSTILCPGTSGLHYSGVAIAPSPISRLPAEVLREIFRLSILEDDIQFNTPRCAILSHVNRLWRTVALFDPSLWTFITTDCGRWIEAHIKRSGNRPLSVRMDIEVLTEATLENIDQVFSQASRLQKIDIYHAIRSETSGGLEPKERDKLCARFFASLQRCFLLPMPMLQTFDLLASELSGRLITLGETPNIQSMKIAGAGLSSSPSLGQLVSLEIRLYVRLPLDKFAAVLATMKNLSDLRIMYPNICEHTVFPASPRAITLPRLKIFRFVGCALGYAILKYFTIDSPVLDCLELGVMEEDSTSCAEPCDPSEILPNFLAMIQFFPSSCFERQSLTIHSTTAGLFTLSLACRPQDAKIRKMVYQAYYVDIAGLYKLLPIGGIRCLTLKEEDDCEESDDEDTNHICVFDLLDGLDSLEEIRLFDPKHLHALSVLLDKHPKILPSLKNLVLRFRQCEEHFTWLQQIMTRRPLRRLTLLDSDISWTKVTLMHHQHREMEIRIWPPMNSSLYAHEVLSNGQTQTYYDSPTNMLPIQFILGHAYDEPVSRLLNESQD